MKPENHEPTYEKGMQMEGPYQKNISEGEKTLLHKNGKTYFSKKTEREFYFVLTIIMLLLGILAKAGIF